jgi:ABC-type sugar transport system ATPase subunit
VPNLLEAIDIRKHFGGVAALAGASFDLLGGEVHALMGENGAGKSTLAKIIAGSVRPDSGVIRIDGEPVEIGSPLDAQHAGIGIIYQELDLFPDLSVGENIVIRNLHFPERAFVDFRRIEEFCRPFLAEVGLDVPSRTLLRSLSIGRRQLVAIARALSMNARILLMDEPTSSLFEDAVDKLFGLIAGLKRRGVAIVYVSHKMDEIFRIADRITVLRDGQTAGTRLAAETSIAEIIRLMVGRDLDTNAPARRVPGEVVLRVQSLGTAKLRDISFELRRGEVLGVAGLVGSGRSELGAALFGIDRIRSGSVVWRDLPLAPRSPAAAMRAGIGLLPEDRKLEGLMMRMSVLENCTLAALPRLHAAGFIRQGQEKQAAAGVRGQLDLKCASDAAAVSTLSGGNQQKALLGRWLLWDPDLLFLDDPARGIDVGAKQDIYRIIDELAARGKAMILVSSELPELLRCSDRILVLSEGRQTALFEAGETSQEQIMAAATSPAEARN